MNPETVSNKIVRVAAAICVALIFLTVNCSKDLSPDSPSRTFDAVQKEFLLLRARARTAEDRKRLAAGYKARAEHNGSFVWSDSTGTEFSSTAANQFLISASGGVGIGTNSPSQMLTVQGNELISGTLTVRGNSRISGEDGPVQRNVYYKIPKIGELQNPSAISAYGNCIAVVSFATNTLTLLDVSNPDNPVFLGYTTSNLQGPVDVQVRQSGGGLAFAALWLSDTRLPTPIHVPPFGDYHLGMVPPLEAGVRSVDPILEYARFPFVLPRVLSLVGRDIHLQALAIPTSNLADMRLTGRWHDVFRD